MTRVYLSGGMEYATNEGRDWRTALQDWLQKELHSEVFNPNYESEQFFRHEYPGIDFRKLKSDDLHTYQTIVSRLVGIDCDEIAQRSTFLICYWDEGAARGAGTKGELTMAKFFNKPAYLVTTMPADQIPGWVLGCTTKIFASFEHLKAFLMANRPA